MTQIDWDNLYKVKIRNYNESTDKHDVVKLILLKKLGRKYRNQLQWIRVYTEYVIGESRIVDIYLENIKNKTIQIYEIQKDYSSKWLESQLEFYKNFTKEPFTIDFIPINLNLLKEDIPSIQKYLDLFVI